MTRIRVLLLALLVCGGIVGAARQNAPGQLPRFQGGVELVVLDASVLDRDRRPVRGLRAEDFTVLESGKPQAVVAFSEINIPDPIEADASSAPWVTEVAPDVRRNVDDASRRIVLIVLDDASPMPMWAAPLARQAARSVIDKLTSEDLAIVAFTSDKRGGQEFTHDKARLRAAADKFHGNTDTKIMNASGFTATNEPASAQGMLAPRLVSDTLRAMAEGLADLPQRRKAMVVISTLSLDLTKLGPRIAMNDGDDSGAMLSTELYEIRQFLAAAQRANVNVYGIDPRGLMTPDSPTGAFSGTSSYVYDPSADARDFLTVISYNTGGFAIVSTNDVGPGVEQLFRENGSYYLLGYAPSNPRTDGRLRRIQLSVKNRPDLQVRVRSGYYEPERPGKKKAVAAAAPVWGSISGTVAKTDLTMQVTGAPFGVAGQPRAAVALVLGLEQPAPPDRAEDTVDVLITAFDATNGKQAASERVKARAALRGGPAGGRAFYEVLSRLDLKPGRYQVRVGADSALARKSGSVYLDLDVPDFTSSRGALSGLVLSVTPGPLASPAGRFAALLPLVPTTMRGFTASDQVVAFLRVYQGVQQAAGPVAVVARITDSANAVVFETPGTVTPVAAGGVRVADYRLTLPIGALAPGLHLLTIDAKIGKEMLRRESRFAVGR